MKEEEKISINNAKCTLPKDKSNAWKKKLEAIYADFSTAAALNGWLLDFIISIFTASIFGFRLSFRCVFAHARVVFAVSFLFLFYHNCMSIASARSHQLWMMWERCERWCYGCCRNNGEHWAIDIAPQMVYVAMPLDNLSNATCCVCVTKCQKTNYLLLCVCIVCTKEKDFLCLCESFARSVHRFSIKMETSRRLFTKWKKRAWTFPTTIIMCVSVCVCVWIVFMRNFHRVCAWGERNQPCRHFRWLRQAIIQAFCIQFAAHWWWLQMYALHKNLECFPLRLFRYGALQRQSDLWPANGAQMSLVKFDGWKITPMERIAIHSNSVSFDFNV